jgi:hypothetical protein
MDLHRLVFTHYMGDLHLEVPQVLHFLSHEEAGPIFEISSRLEDVGQDNVALYHRASVQAG